LALELLVLPWCSKTAGLKEAICSLIANALCSSSPVTY